MTRCLRGRHAAASSTRGRSRIRASPHPSTFKIYEKEIPGEPEQHCDFIFVSEHLKPRVAAVRVDRATQAADHQPVILTLEYDSQASSSVLRGALRYAPAHGRSRAHGACATSVPPAATFAACAAAGGGGARRAIARSFDNFFRRELFSRYLGSVTGLAWALLHPLALLAVYWFVFTSVFRAGAMNGKSSPALRRRRAVAVARRSGGTVTRNGQHRRLCGADPQSRFPHELVVYASVAATLALQFAGYLAVLVVLALFGEPVRFEGLLLAVPLWIVLAVAVTGITLALAALQVFIKDIEHILMPLLMIPMYLTPILYPLSLVPEGMKPWVAANPFGYWSIACAMRSSMAGSSWLGAMRWPSSSPACCSSAGAGSFCGCRRTSRISSDHGGVAGTFRRRQGLRQGQCQRRAHQARL